ncbi:MAG: hypothetical protein ACM3SY_22505 [Candidatus Omnitrophota bacterium]
MEYVFEGTVLNELKDNQNLSVTVFKKKEGGWDKLLDPIFGSEKKNFSRVTSHYKNITLSIALNQPVGSNKECKVTKMENGSYKGPNPVGNFKWEIEITSGKEKAADPAANIEIEIANK